MGHPWFLESAICGVYAAMLAVSAWMATRADRRLAIALAAGAGLFLLVAAASAYLAAQS